MVKHTMRREGICGFYKGLSASQLSGSDRRNDSVGSLRAAEEAYGEYGAKGGAMEWLGMLGSAGMAKCVASLITYPHKVRLCLLLSDS
jgi:solute carrier family 25, member 33/36